MKHTVLFIGTGAADGMKDKFENDFSDYDKRRCASLLVDGHILFDCGPHTLDAAKALGVDPANITDVVITHFHADHFHRESVMKIAKAGQKTFHFWLRDDAVFIPFVNCVVHRMVPFEPNAIGGLCVVGMPANHGSYAQHLSVEEPGFRLFYGLDGAWLLNETVQYMRGKKYDVMILDATVGDTVGDYRIGEHNSIPMLRLMVPSFEPLEIADRNTQFIISHLAMCLHKSHERTQQLVEEDGFTVAYDGMVWKN